MPVKKPSAKATKAKKTVSASPAGGQGCRQAVFEAEDAGPGH